MLEIRRDLAQRNEFVSFLIRRVVNPCLQAALHVHRGGRWVDPAGSQKHQRSKRPKKRHSDEKPAKEGSERAFAMRVARESVWIFSHTLE
jgi:predicted acyl esterase